MITIPKSNYAGLATMKQRRLDRDFDCFKARVAQSCLSQTEIPSLKCDPTQFLAEERLARRGMHVSHRMQQEMALLQNSFSDFRMGVAMSGNGKSRSQIEIAIIVCIPSIDPIGSLPDNRDLIG